MSIQALPELFALWILGVWSEPILRWNYVRRISPNAVHPYEADLGVLQSWEA